MKKKISLDYCMKTQCRYCRFYDVCFEYKPKVKKMGDDNNGK